MPFDRKVTEILLNCPVYMFSCDSRLRDFGLKGASNEQHYSHHRNGRAELYGTPPHYDISSKDRRLLVETFPENKRVKAAYVDGSGKLVDNESKIELGEMSCDNLLIYDKVTSRAERFASKHDAPAIFMHGSITRLDGTPFVVRDVASSDARTLEKIMSNGNFGNKPLAYLKIFGNANYTPLGRYWPTDRGTYFITTAFLPQDHEVIGPILESIHTHVGPLELMQLLMPRGVAGLYYNSLVRFPRIMAAHDHVVEND